MSHPIHSHDTSRVRKNDIGTKHDCVDGIWDGRSSFWKSRSIKITFLLDTNYTNHFLINLFFIQNIKPNVINSSLNHLVPSMKKVFVDLSAITQTFFFLIQNCFKYTPQTSWLINVRHIVRETGQKSVNRLRSFNSAVTPVTPVVGTTVNSAPGGASDLFREMDVNQQSYTCKP